MKIGLVTLLIVASAFGADIETCRLDVDNGCRDYSSAEKCGVTDACKSLVWIRPVHNCTILCQRCLDDVKNLEKFVSANTTRDFVKYDLLATCRLVFPEAARNRCREIIEDYFDKIYKDIVNNLDPTVVCNALHFCYPKDEQLEMFDDCKMDEDHACKDYTTAEKCHATSYCKSVIWRQPSNNQTKCCKKCLEAVGKLEDFISSNATRDRVKHDLLATCGLLWFEGQRERCRDMVNQNFDQIYDDLEKRLDPNVVCRALRICQPKEHEAILETSEDCKLDEDHACMDYATAKKCHASSYCKATIWKQPANNQTKCCKECLAVVGKLEDFISANATRDRVKQDLLAACNFLWFHGQRQRCRDMINLNFDDIYDDLEKHLDPNVICRALRICQPKDRDSVTVKNSDCILDSEEVCHDYSTAAKCDAISQCKSTIWRNPVNNETMVCKMCLEYVGQIEKFVKANATHDAIKRDLLLACSLLPFEAERRQCTSMVNENFEQIYQDLVDDLDPCFVCAAMRLCHSKIPAPFLDEKSSKDVNRDECALDEYNACEDYTAAQRCHATSECKMTVWKQPVDETLLCKLCLDDIKDLHDYVNANVTRQFVKNTLTNLCEFIPFEAPRNKCLANLDENFDRIYQDIVDELDSTLLCQALRFCCPKDGSIDGILVGKMKESLAKYQVTVPRRPVKVDFKESNCDLCINSFEAMEKWGRFIPRDSLKQELDEYCHILLDPAQTKECCDRVEKDFDKIYDAVIARTDPALLCRELGVCGEKPLEEKIKVGFEVL